MKFLLFFYLIVFCVTGFAQDQLSASNENEIDTAYKEDQFYFGLTYNLLGEKPDGVAQNGFSSGFHFGIIKDMPVNERRNVAFGIGAGYSANAINQNILISKDELGNQNYTLVNSGEFRRNKITLHMLEVPFEFRWRTSTPESYSFWRLYTGIKLGYVFSSTSKYKGSPDDVKLRQLNDLNDLQYGFTFSAGYGRINVHLYYALSTLFKNDATLNGEEINMNVIKIGLMLYIL